MDENDIERVLRIEARRVLATLVRLLGDFDRAEEATQEAFPVALEGGEVSLSDGPFIEGKELIPGFTVIRVDSKRDAIDWATKLRRCMGDGEIRIVQVITPGFDDSKL